MSSPRDLRSGRRSIALAVLTYHRAELLPQLLTDLDREAGSLTSADGVRLLVIDNDPAGSARDAVEEQQTLRALDYVVEPRRGIAAARNRALSECASDDVIVFIDDDERPDQGWLALLLQTFDDYRPAAVSGPVRTVYVEEPDAWAVAGGFIDRSHRDHTPTGGLLDEAATNNLLLDLAEVRRLGLGFEESVGLSSGEDAIFTRRLTSAGARIVWCAEAWVSDLRPGERTTKLALLRRAYSFSNAAVLVRVTLAHGLVARVGVRLRAVVGGAARIAVGLVSFVVGVGTMSVARRARGARLVARGCGALFAGVGVRYEEYARSAEWVSGPASAPFTAAVPDAKRRW